MNSGPIAACAHIKSWLLPGLLTLGSIAAALSISLAPPASGPVAAVFPPWWAAARSMLAAANAGSVVRFGASFVVIVVPDVRHPVAALRAGGAWFVVNPQLLGGCGAARQPENPL
jgi:hypothetical protein